MITAFFDATIRCAFSRLTYAEEKKLCYTCFGSIALFSRHELRHGHSQMVYIAGRKKIKQVEEGHLYEQNFRCQGPRTNQDQYAKSASKLCFGSMEPSDDLAICLWKTSGAYSQIPNLLHALRW